MTRGKGAQRDETRLCASCGRPFGWRKKWAKQWDEVRYCSERCRRRRRKPVDARLEEAIASMLADRSGSLCPSEVARRVGGEDWRPLMEPTRAAGRRMAARGEVVFTQRGRAVDPATARGALRIARRPAFTNGSTARASAKGTPMA